MLHQIPCPPTEAARYVGGHIDVPPRESHESSTRPASVLPDLTGCHLGAGQDVPFNGHTADFRWSGVFGTTWDSNVGQGEPFNEEVVCQRWTGNFGPTYNSDLNQGLLSHNQRADQKWSGVFGNGWHSCLDPHRQQQKYTRSERVLWQFRALGVSRALYLCMLVISTAEISKYIS